MDYLRANWQNASAGTSMFVVVLGVPLFLVPGWGGIGISLFSAGMVSAFLIAAVPAILATAAEARINREIAERQHAARSKS
jgi:hypothetical protein